MVELRVRSAEGLVRGMQSEFSEGRGIVGAVVRKLPETAQLELSCPQGVRERVPTSPPCKLKCIRSVTNPIGQRDIRSSTKSRRGQRRNVTA